MPHDNRAWNRPWFAPKRFGYGAGLPIAWQGWVVLVAMIAGLLVLMRVIRSDQPANATLAIVAYIAVWLPLIAKKTRGGWKWRTGRE